MIKVSKEFDWFIKHNYNHFKWYQAKHANVTANGWTTLSDTVTSWWIKFFNHLVEVEMFLTVMEKHMVWAGTYINNLRDGNFVVMIFLSFFLSATSRNTMRCCSSVLNGEFLKANATFLSILGNYSKLRNL